MRLPSPFAISLCGAVLALNLACKTTPLRDDAVGSSSAVVKAEATAASAASIHWSLTNGADGATVKGEQGAGPFKCAAPTVINDHMRLICQHGKSQLDVIIDDVKASAAVVSYPDGYKSAKSFQKCTVAPGNEQTIELSCALSQPDSRRDGKFVSPFDSTVAGLSIHNTHLISTKAPGRGAVLRGMAPLDSSDAKELTNYGVGSVLIFKTPEGHRDAEHNEISAETEQLLAAGIPANEVLNIPFPWYGITSFAEPCKQTVQALKFIQERRSLGRNVFFHCTVGEDRTGYLAGLFRMLNDGINATEAFQNEMCEHGYGGGNPQKPYAGVIEKIDGDLTPLFLFMVAQVESGALSLDHLDESICETTPKVAPSLKAQSCATSVNFHL